MRHYQGPEDVAVWLDLRRRAFARQRVGVRDWDASDFEREFLEKSWWRPDAMWFALWDNRANLTGTPYLMNSWWNPNRRIKQYEGSHWQKGCYPTRRLDVGGKA